MRLNRHQRGAVFVDAAIIMPVFLLVTFVTIFLCLMAYRLSSIQMAANDIAQSISKAFYGGGPFYCAPGAPTVQQRKGTILIQDLRGACEGSWRSGIATKYLIPTDNQMPITVVGYAHLPPLDGGQNVQNATTLRAGDSFVVLVKFPKTNILGGKVPLFGLLSGDLVASAAGFIERPKAD